MSISFYTDRSSIKPLDKRLLGDASEETKNIENAKILAYKKRMTQMEIETNLKKQQVTNSVIKMGDEARAKMHQDEDAYYAYKGEMRKFEDAAYDAKMDFERQQYLCPEGSGVKFAQTEFNTKSINLSKAESNLDSLRDRWRSSIFTAKKMNNCEALAIASAYR